MKCLRLFRVLFIALGFWVNGIGAQDNAYSPADIYELQARLYIAGDDHAGSFLTRNPAQRHLFGFPLEPITEFESRSTTYPDFTKALINHLWQTPAWKAAGESQSRPHIKRGISQRLLSRDAHSGYVLTAARIPCSFSYSGRYVFLR